MCCFYKLCITIVAIACLGNCGTTATISRGDLSSKAFEEVETQWSIIKKLEHAPGDPEVAAKWLNESARQLSVPFWQMCDAPDVEGRLGVFVDKFGLQGPDADLAWMLSQPQLLIADRSAVFPSFKDWPDQNERGEFREGARSLQRMICKAQVECFLKDPVIFRRYYRAVMWSGMLFGYPSMDSGGFSAAIGTLVRKFPAAPDEDYWGYARHFMLVAHATGRDDLFLGRSPGDLRSGFLLWRDWIINSGENSIHFWKPDHQTLTWRYVPDSQPHSFEFVQLPDRPFDDLSSPVPYEVDFAVIIPNWDESDYPAKETVRRLVTRLGREWTSRKSQ